MKLIINGDTKELPQNITLKRVIEELNLDGKVMAAALNMEIVKQDKWESCILKDMDKVELLDFVGGG
ncbi:MAG: sulfur carrier protein ThiS [Sulfurimonas sp.]|uniref:sulfur carrier protein ThiS n=1 Tax=Sulfurimonas sp. TaxID=2022749 RepID=UPI0028CCDF8A|nr:sulfur carrier protein ThiS [Sulfurimonas sp.]MDT8339095.1 sulfur carrier protein ThiS [Sulfurimonas sp.]